MKNHPLYRVESTITTNWPRTALLALALSCTAGAGTSFACEHEHGDAGHGGKPETQSVIPPALQEEHHELHAMLGRAVKLKGPVGEAAKAVEKELAPHFRREEQIALPQLGALLALAEGRPVAGKEQLLQASDSLRMEYPRMIEEHKSILAAVARFKEAAEKAKLPEYVRFADGLMQHARMEEEVLYPAALLVGRSLRDKH